VTPIVSRIWCGRGCSCFPDSQLGLACQQLKATRGPRNNKLQPSLVHSKTLAPAPALVSLAPSRISSWPLHSSPSTQVFGSFPIPHHRRKSLVPFSLITIDASPWFSFTYKINQGHLLLIPSTNITIDASSWFSFTHDHWQLLLVPSFSHPTDQRHLSLVPISHDYWHPLLVPLPTDQRHQSLVLLRIPDYWPSLSHPLNIDYWHRLLVPFPSLHCAWRGIQSEHARV
jgi:hypothetical protein